MGQIPQKRRKWMEIVQIFSILNILATFWMNIINEPMPIVLCIQTQVNSLHLYEMQKILWYVVL